MTGTERFLMAKRAWLGEAADAIGGFAKDLAWSAVPGSGFVDAAKNIGEGNLWSAAGNTAMGALSFVPGLGAAGRMGQKVLGKYGGKFLGNMAAKAPKLMSDIKATPSVQRLGQTRVGQAAKGFGNWTEQNKGKAYGVGGASSLFGSHIQGIANETSQAIAQEGDAMKGMLQQIHQSPVFQNPIYAQPPAPKPLWSYLGGGLETQAESGDQPNAFGLRGKFAV
jgi:hypothetical protein